MDSDVKFVTGSESHGSQVCLGKFPLRQGGGCFRWADLRAETHKIQAAEGRRGSAIPVDAF